MRIPSEDIPQADVLDDVIRTVEAVDRGARSFGEIARALGKVDRQGRYYRRAAEILGFIHNSQNRSVLTARGREFLRKPDDRARFLADAVLKSRLIQRVIPFLESKRARGVSRQEMEQFIEEVTEPVGQSMIPRRVSTVLSWLERINIIRERNERFQLSTHLPYGIEIVEYEDAGEPLFPKRYTLEEYRSVARKIHQAQGYINVLINEAARERAEGSHQMLMNLVAAKIRKAGSIPKNNKYVDLSAAIHDELYLFEMKSTTERNVHMQIRRAISQLYEYRYLQEVPAAKLVVVIENPPPKEKKWIVEYLIKDRNVLIAWDGNGSTLQFPTETGSDLRFLG